MNKKIKIWFVVASLFILAGVGLFVVVMSANGWNFYKLETSNYVENNYTIEQGFDSIVIDNDTTDILFVESTNTVCKVTCFEREKDSCWNRLQAWKGMF